MDQCEFYCVCYNSPERAAIMTERFQKIGAQLNINTGVQMDDPRLAGAPDIHTKRVWSVCYGHIDNMAAFLKTDKKYGFTCEDDVHIRRDLGILMPSLIRDFELMELDIMLLGYMTPYPILDWYTGYHFRFSHNLARGHQYHNYPNEQWGIHLAMFSREYAQKVVDTFGYTGDDATSYANKTLTDNTLSPFNPDWTITKLTTHRALIYPMLAVEDGKGNYDHFGQGEYHRNSHEANYDPLRFY